MASAATASLSSPVVSLDVHRGAIDQTTITTQPPQRVMQRMRVLLCSIGIRVEEESTFRYRCIRAKKVEDTPSNQLLYGSPTEDPADEVRFTVELTRLVGLNDTYSLDIRRLKGNLRSYKFIYDTIRERAQLN